MRIKYKINSFGNDQQTKDHFIKELEDNKWIPMETEKIMNLMDLNPKETYRYKERGPNEQEKLRGYIIAGSPGNWYFGWTSNIYNFSRMLNNLKDENLLGTPIFYGVPVHR